MPYYTVVKVLTAPEEGHVPEWPRFKDEGRRQGKFAANG